MEILTLEYLLNKEDVKPIKNGLRFSIKQSMIIDGEERLSYASLVRLIECCRELHWIRDVKKNDSNSLTDSICKHVSLSFNCPIMVGMTVEILYNITQIGTTSYTLSFICCEHQQDVVLASAEMVNVFVNPQTLRPSKPPVEVMDWFDSIKL